MLQVMQKLVHKILEFYSGCWNGRTARQGKIDSLSLCLMIFTWSLDQHLLGTWCWSCKLVWKKMDILVLLLKTSMCVCVCILSCCIYVEFSIFFSHEFSGAIFFLSNSHAPDGPFLLLLPSIIRSSISISIGTSGKELNEKVTQF